MMDDFSLDLQVPVWSSEEGVVQVSVVCCRCEQWQQQQQPPLVSPLPAHVSLLLLLSRARPRG